MDRELRDTGDVLLGRRSDARTVQDAGRVYSRQVGAVCRLDAQPRLGVQAPQAFQARGAGAGAPSSTTFRANAWSILPRNARSAGYSLAFTRATLSATSEVQTSFAS